VQKCRQFLRRGVPARAPVAIHTEAKSNRINFLSHKLLFRFLLPALAFAAGSRRRCRFFVRLAGFCFLPGLFLFLFSFRLSRFSRLDLNLIALENADMNSALSYQTTYSASSPHHPLQH